MIFENIIPDKSVSLFIKNILVFEEYENTSKTILPFFADGYPGLIFQETQNGLLVNPHRKQMPVLFLYGQTIHPIELVMEGNYKLIIFQLYPFVLKSFFELDPKSINDNCYDLMQLDDNKIEILIQKLKVESNFKDRINLLSDFLYTRFRVKKSTIDFKIKQSLELILDNKGQLSIGKVCEDLKLNERTFERRFINEVGISAKKFSQIIQFQHTLEQLTVKDYTKLTDIVYTNGFADQSHFIKVFKAFTGKTPKKFNQVRF
ncbi:AraC family transcriptional regulator [Emticicia sp. C21]|uniref:helix-turn-helix domain-containing protein n=1 Tax=Emticicia sp. C21 TaxID=2302915 RepID=UPI000E344C84|nr:AraC family transcriptional regulator [Emticicia sp. C21]RFS16250.1 AraC family transcriptional regulator [Emticicia sp. C21]